MARYPKFAILEIDGNELPGPSEYVPESCDIVYIAAGSETVKDRLDSIQNGYRFNYGMIDRDIVIPSDKAMVMVNPIVGNNEIKVYGELVIL